MAERVETAAVLGAGVMGMGIAAHLASAGIRTHLLDITPRDLPPNKDQDPNARSAIAADAIKNALKAKPAVFLDPGAAKLITPGNFDDHLDRLRECDLVIEAVVENIKIKKSLFAKVAKEVGPNTILASNTSGLSLAHMTEDLSHDLQSRSCVMHFFNPVRYMRLLEVVRGQHTSDATIARVEALGEFLGKGVVYAKDTTNFIANRIGTYALNQAIQVMDEYGLSIEQVDKIAGPPMARPKTGAFKLSDMVGLDTLKHVAQNCYDTLTSDPERNIFQFPPWITELINSGAHGRKAGRGFYKREGSETLVYDRGTKTYRKQAKVRFESLGAIKNIEEPGQRVKALIEQQDSAAKFAWHNLASTLIYSARLIPEIADDIVNIDRALRWGFNWDLGPFELWDAIGVRTSVERMQKDGMDVPPGILAMLSSGRETFYDGPRRQQTFFNLVNRAVAPVPVNEQHLTFVGLKQEADTRVVKKNLGASLVDLGDGALALEVHTKMNTIDDDVIKMMVTAREEAEKNFEALVIANDGGNFGAGANLMLIMMGAQSGEWSIVEQAISGLQNALQELRYATVPVVAAPYGLTLGGCCEIAMAADACQAHAETYMGLVEVGAGLIPAGGGCLRMVERWTGPVDGTNDAVILPFIAAPSLQIATATVATGAVHAQQLRYLLPTDGISLNRDLLLSQAKARALGMAKAGYRPPLPRTLKAAGIDTAKSIEMSIWGMVEGQFASTHDALIAGKVAHILCGGHVAAGTELTEQNYLDLEREAFLSLCGEEKTQARIQNLLMTGKPLRN
ncbi:MAG: 3-hydroxyacyl-CoA dehydrogenase/enoyl-CoA hydratase family protein [Myxococcales bacterium]|nr:3-hydroxyacyl-CoA dehydrogenase/enoyl-CoA hydratase family protein [Myxococcales bacterium]